MRWILQLALLTVLVVAGTWIGGWWMVPAVGALYGFVVMQDRAASLTAALAGAIGWGAILAFDSSRGPVVHLAQVVGGMIHMAGPWLLVLAITYATVLCASAAAFARSLRGWNGQPG